MTFVSFTVILPVRLVWALRVLKGRFVILKKLLDL